MSTTIIICIGLSRVDARHWSNAEDWEGFSTKIFHIRREKMKINMIEEVGGGGCNLVCLSYLSGSNIIYKQIYMGFLELLGFRTTNDLMLTPSLLPRDAAASRMISPPSSKKNLTKSSE